VRALLASRYALFAAVILAIAGLFGVAWISRPAAGHAAGAGSRAHVAQVTSATRSCPEPGAGDRVAVFAAPGQGVPPGRAELLAAPATVVGASGTPATGVVPAIPAAPLATVAGPGRLWLSGPGFAVGRTPRAARRATRGQAGAVTVTATGAMAQGLDAEQTFYPPNGSAGVVSGVQCAQPGTDFWFVGPGQAKTGDIRVYLVNPDSEPAAADVEIFTDTGPLQGNADTGIAVPPGGSVVQSIGTLIKGSQVVALHVRTSVGRVAAAVQAAGAWWRCASPPSTEVVIPGLPGASTGRRLFLIDPGGNDAQVQVKAVTPAGSYEPAGAGGIEVPAGSAVALDLPSLNGIPAALLLKSAVPVTAALLVGQNAFTAATGPIAQQGVVADNTTSSGYTVSLVLSAPGTAAQVRITTADLGGPVGTGRLVAIQAGRSLQIQLAVPHIARSGFAVVVSPAAGSGPVYAGRVLATRSAAVQLITPVVSSPTWVRLPVTSGSGAAAIP
jgi:Family of unknown function (DUF5719)